MVNTAKLSLIATEKIHTVAPRLSNLTENIQKEEKNADEYELPSKNQYNFKCKVAHRSNHKQKYWN